MKKIFVITCFLFSYVCLYAQQAVKVEYDYHFYTVRGVETHRPMILTSSTTQSKFYNPDTNRIDSAYNTPEKKAAFDAYINSRIWSKDEIPPTRWEKMYVEKDRNNNVMTVYDTVAGEDRYYYNEPFGEIIWEVKDSTETILDYECLMAECNYHGRHWTILFTPELPISDGPWKLNGLPGLILRAQDDSGQYEFTAAQTGINLPKNMKSIEIKKTYDYLETDYR